MKILAIDTSSSICSTAILDDEVLIDKNELNNGRTHSENLMPLIDELLKRNNITSLFCWTRFFYWYKNWCSFYKSNSRSFKNKSCRSYFFRNVGKKCKRCRYNSFFN